MTRCFDCRAEVADERWRCDACCEKKQDAMTLDRLRGVHGHRGVGGAKVHLSPEERKSIERLTGVKVWDAQDARRACKMTNMRPLDKGEELDEAITRQQAGESVPFVGWDKLGVLPTVKPFDFEKRLQAHEARFRK